MKYHNTIDIIVSYIGIKKRTISYYKQRGLNFDVLIEQLKSCDRFGCQRIHFYETFIKYANDEGVVERLWDIFVDHRFKVEELEQLTKARSQRIKKALKEIKEGRIT
jgi:hypothetical protein